MCPVPKEIMTETLVVKMLGPFLAEACHVTSVGESIMMRRSPPLSD